MRKLIAKLMNWSRTQEREYNRTLTIKFLVEIPYSAANERLLRKADGTAVKVGEVNTIVKAAVLEKLPFQYLDVKCVGNPDWRKNA